MNLLFKISEIYLPSWIKKKELMNLFRITASAFESTVPPTAGLSFEECLAAFAHFTKFEIDQLMIRNKDLHTIQDRLYHSAYEFGDKFRIRFRVSSISDVMAVSRFLYRILGIDFQGTHKGSITICKCFFSEIYSSSTCRVISSLDSGMMAGLSGGGGLIFSHRITEDFDACKARYFSKEQIQ
jgi:hypothetical protein